MQLHATIMQLLTLEVCVCVGTCICTRIQYTCSVRVCVCAHAYSIHVVNVCIYLLISMFSVLSGGYGLGTTPGERTWTENNK